MEHLSLLDGDPATCVVADICLGNALERGGTTAHVLTLPLMARIMTFIAHVRRPCSGRACWQRAVLLLSPQVFLAVLARSS